MEVQNEESKALISTERDVINEFQENMQEDISYLKY